MMDDKAIVWIAFFASLAACPLVFVADRCRERKHRIWLAKHRARFVEECSGL